MKGWLRYILTPYNFALAVCLLAIFLAPSGFNLASCRYAKEKLPLRRPLADLPEFLGPYQRYAVLPRLHPDEERALKADSYVAMVYRDTRISLGAPGSLLRLHLAYYSGITSVSITHLPQICLVASGSQAYGSSKVGLTLDDGKKFTANLFLFGAPGVSGEKRGVIYFFIVNGRLASSELAVRLADLKFYDRYSYWCKVEMAFDELAQVDEMAKAAGDFLTYALPAIRGILPSWLD